jgi:hypothetical protein
VINHVLMQQFGHSSQSADPHILRMSALHRAMPLVTRLSTLLSKGFSVADSAEVAIHSTHIF